MAAWTVVRMVAVRLLEEGCAARLAVVGYSLVA
jgi:hypothetical protein